MSSTLIWPWWVRVSHWLVAIGIFLLWVLAYAYFETDKLHRTLGYAVIGVVLVRILVGFFTRVATARLTFPSWGAISEHVKHLAQKQLPIIHGHNPLGQLAVYVMWVLMILLGITGWLSQTDAYWGEDWPVDLHAWLSFSLMAIVILHLIAVVVMSILQKQNLAKSMLTGHAPAKLPTRKK